jgi:hypothetical protein
MKSPANNVTPNKRPVTFSGTDAPQKNKKVILFISLKLCVLLFIFQVRLGGLSTRKAK